MRSISLNEVSQGSNSPAHCLEPPNSESGTDAMDIEVHDRLFLCPVEGCGRRVKDHKAHMLTHLNERPQKCPIKFCEYNSKGFARKYDQVRHTLKHFKGILACDYCSPVAPSGAVLFNYVEDLKRHLVHSHGVEVPHVRVGSRSSASPPSPNSHLGTCSTCFEQFISPGDLYHHLDDCILQTILAKSPTESVAASHLVEINDDPVVQATLRRHKLSLDTVTSTVKHKGGVKEDEEAEIKVDSPSTDSDDEGEMSNTQSSPRMGLTRSKGGIRRFPIGINWTVSGSRRIYPRSWGSKQEDMTLHKRVLCVYDGQRRLWKDDLMMHNQSEVGIQHSICRAFNEDSELDEIILKRAEAIHGATEEERGPWRPDNIRNR
jgi:hypothetical protein